MSFACPHLDLEHDACLRLRTDCVPGRPGCVLGDKAVFAVPAVEGIKLREEEKRRAAELTGLSRRELPSGG